MYFGLHTSAITHLNSNSLKNIPAHKISPLTKALIPYIVTLYCLLKSITSLFQRNYLTSKPDLG